MRQCRIGHLTEHLEHGRYSIPSQSLQLLGKREGGENGRAGQKRRRGSPCGVGEGSWCWGRGHRRGQAGLEVGCEQRHRLLLLLVVG